MCWLFHKWTKWVEIFPYGQYGVLRYQQKQCTKCGIIEERHF